MIHSLIYNCTETNASGVPNEILLIINELWKWGCSFSDIFVFAVERKVVFIDERLLVSIKK
jgi:hypothetical protein